MHYSHLYRQLIKSQQSVYLRTNCFITCYECLHRSLCILPLQTVLTLPSVKPVFLKRSDLWFIKIGLFYSAFSQSVLCRAVDCKRCSWLVSRVSEEAHVRLHPLSHMIEESVLVAGHCTALKSLMIYKSVIMLLKRTVCMLWWRINNNNKWLNVWLSAWSKANWLVDCCRTQKDTRTIKAV